MPPVDLLTLQVSLFRDLAQHPLVGKSSCIGSSALRVKFRNLAFFISGVKSTSRMNTFTLVTTTLHSRSTSQVGLTGEGKSGQAGRCLFYLSDFGNMRWDWPSDTVAVFSCALTRRIVFSFSLVFLECSVDRT